MGSLHDDFASVGECLDARQLYLVERLESLEKRVDTLTKQIVNILVEK